MGTFYNPKIVTDGLIGCYDPGSKLSYSGSGSALNDLTKNYDATLVGSPAFNQTFSAGDMILRNTSDYGGQIGSLPDRSWYIPSFFAGVYFLDATLFSSSGGTFVNGTDTVYILNTDGSLYLSIDSSVSAFSGSAQANGQRVKYTLFGSDLDGFAGPTNTTAGQTFNSALAAAADFNAKKTAWQNYVNATVTLPASGGTPFNSVDFKISLSLPTILPALDTFTFEDNQSITLGSLPQTQQYTYEFLFAPVDYTDASNNNYQKMLVNSANSFFIIMEENRVFRHRVPGVDATGNIGNNTVFAADQFHIATFSYDQSVSKNYRNGELLQSKSVGSGTVDAGTLSLFSSSGPVQQYVGGFGFFRAYDRALTDQEVKQNFEATRARFNL